MSRIKVFEGTANRYRSPFPRIQAKSADGPSSSSPATRLGNTAPCSQHLQRQFVTGANLTVWEPAALHRLRPSSLLGKIKTRVDGVCSCEMRMHYTPT